jgi:hypothetical protein
VMLPKSLADALRFTLFQLAHAHPNHELRACVFFSLKHCGREHPHYGQRACPPFTRTF